MALKYADRVSETTTTTGTGTYSLAGARTGFRTFVAGIATGNTCYYAVTDDSGNWEVGLGTVTSGSPDTLSRGTIIASSNSDLAVSWAAGTKTVFATAPSILFPPVIDTTSLVKGSSDATKQVRLEVDGLTSGATRVLTVPDSDLTIAGVDFAQSWTAVQTFVAQNAASVPLIAKAASARSATVSNKALTSNVATLTTSSAHGFVTGETVVVAAVDATFNGTFTITGTPSSTTFTYAKTAANVASTAATGTATISLTAAQFEVRDSAGTARLGALWDGSKVTLVTSGVSGVWFTGAGSTGVFKLTFGGADSTFQCDNIQISTTASSVGAKIRQTDSILLLASNWKLAFGSATNLGGSVAGDTAFTRVAAGVFGITDGSTGGGTLASVPLSPTQITADQNNYAPGVAMFYRLSTDASRTLTGLSCSQVTGQIIRITNVGSNNLVLAHQSASSTSTNRFLCKGAADLTLAADEEAHGWYDGTTQRWRIAKI